MKFLSVIIQSSIHFVIAIYISNCAAKFYLVLRFLLLLCIFICLYSLNNSFQISEDFNSIKAQYSLIIWKGQFYIIISLGKRKIIILI